MGVPHLWALAIHPSNHVNSDVHTKNKLKKKRENTGLKEKKKPHIKNKVIKTSNTTAISGLTKQRKAKTYRTKLQREATHWPNSPCD